MEKGLAKWNKKSGWNSTMMNWSWSKWRPRICFHSLWKEWEMLKLNWKRPILFSVGMWNLGKIFIYILVVDYFSGTWVRKKVWDPKLRKKKFVELFENIHSSLTPDLALIISVHYLVKVQINFDIDIWIESYFSYQAILSAFILGSIFILHKAPLHS